MMDPSKPAKCCRYTYRGVSVAELEKAITEQGNKVRDLKASTKDKSVWQPEVKKLLDLKKQLAAAQTTPPSAKGDKVRKLKASTKDKAVWQPEVNVLLDLKKRLAALQINK